MAQGRRRLARRMTTAELAARQIVFEAFMIATLGMLGRADFKTFNATFLDATKQYAISRLRQEKVSGRTLDVSLAYADYLLSEFSEHCIPKQPKA